MRGWHETILPLAAALAVTLLIGWPGGKMAAAREDHGQWTPTGLKGYTLRLFTPPSGAHERKRQQRQDRTQQRSGSSRRQVARCSPLRPAEGSFGVTTLAKAGRG
jgi:hypothetical protein